MFLYLATDAGRFNIALGLGSDKYSVNSASLESCKMQH